MAAEPSSRLLTLGYIAALTMVAVMSLASHVVLDRTLVAHAGAASVINVSGRQRMLSQRIASLAAQSALGDVAARADLKTAIDDFELAHARLLHGDPARGLPAPSTPELQALYFSGARPLDGQVRAYIAEARLVEALPAGDPRLKTVLPPLFAAARKPLLAGLNAVTTEHQRMSEAQLQTLKTLQMGSLTLILVTLLAEALGIFRPMVRKIIQYTSELNRAATIDPLTGVFNRRCFTDRGLTELARAARYGRQTALLMIDADRFKSINDTHGHGVGDDVLIALTGALGLALRPSDLLGRLGGEEFAVILPETGLEGAQYAAERLREAVAALRISTPSGDIAFTVSVGVTNFAPGETVLKPALDRADAALYAAKAGGRNRVATTLHDPLVVEAATPLAAG
ncbi:MAG: diguanylate cyclase [Caulobacteraceae bacterium]